jgi:hypothetical protein
MAPHSALLAAFLGAGAAGQPLTALAAAPALLTRGTGACVQIRAVDRLGNPVEDGGSFCVDVDARPRGAASEPGAGCLARSWRRGQPQTWIVDPGRGYACGWFSPSRGLVERHVQLAGDAGERDLTFVVGDPAPPSTLVVNVLGAAAERQGLGVGVRIESTICPAVLASLGVRTLRAPGKDFRFELPAGRYRVRALTARPGGGRAGPSPERAGVARLVDLGLGDELRVELQLA